MPVRAGLLMLALAALVAIAGCGSSGSNGSGAGAAANGATGVQQHYIRVVKVVSPQVVQIQGKRGLGSGVVFDNQSNIVTNAHVVAQESQFVVTLSGGAQHPATLVGTDPAHDLAVVRVSGATPAPASFANSSNIQVGDLVLAIGNPLGLRSSVTDGIVSSLNRSVSEGNGVTLSQAIQTTAAINPGNSGGALVDLTGSVIGIPTLAALDPQLGGGQASGIGFAIPSNTVKQVATRLIGPGQTRPLLQTK
jgi:S1-C subfamily serine protease